MRVTSPASRVVAVQRSNSTTSTAVEAVGMVNHCELIGDATQANARGWYEAHMFATSVTKCKFGDLAGNRRTHTLQFGLAFVFLTAARLLKAPIVEGATCGRPFHVGAATNRGSSHLCPDPLQVLLPSEAQLDPVVDKT